MQTCAMGVRCYLGALGQRLDVAHHTTKLASAARLLLVQIIELASRGHSFPVNINRHI